MKVSGPVFPLRVLVGRRSAPHDGPAPRWRRGGLGVSDPLLAAPDFAPGLDRGSLTPTLSGLLTVLGLSMQLPRACPVVATTRPSLERCSASSRLVAALRPRASSARGLRALTAPPRRSPDGNGVMATICVPSARRWMPVQENRVQARSE